MEWGTAKAHELNTGDYVMCEDGKVRRIQFVLRDVEKGITIGLESWRVLDDLPFSQEFEVYR